MRALPQPLLLTLAQRLKLLCKSLRARRPLEKLHQKPLRLVVPLAPTSGLFRRERHNLFFAEAGAEIDKGVELFFSAAIVRAFVFGEFGGGVEGRAGCGLEFDDEDFEDFEGCRDNVPWIWI